jgi:hypothetical protein
MLLTLETLSVKISLSVVGPTCISPLRGGDEPEKTTNGADLDFTRKSSKRICADYVGVSMIPKLTLIIN